MASFASSFIPNGLQIHARLSRRLEGCPSRRAVGHGTADFLTLGLWEVVGTPIEGVANGTEMTVEVAYENDRVVGTNAIQGAHKMPVAAR